MPQTVGRGLLATFFVAALTVAPASAGSILLETYGFECLSSNSIYCKGGQPLENQFSLEVRTVDGNSNQVDFTFLNGGSTASSITDVYFDDGTLLGIAQIITSSGVRFSQGASPSNLPGGNAIDFDTSAGFLADSDAPVQPNGVNPGEWLTIRYDLINGQTADTIVDALSLSLTDPTHDIVGGLRVGIHVQGLPNGQSESLVNGPGLTPVPEPSSLALLGTGLYVAVRRLRRGNRSRTAEQS